MPELPEVETVKMGLSPVMEGASISAVHLSRTNLRFPYPKNFRNLLQGQNIVSLGRRAKYLLADLASGNVLVMHLGMSGSFRIEDMDHDGKPVQKHIEKPKSIKHDHVRFELVDKKGNRKRIIYNDPRRFGYMDLVPRSKIEEHPLFAGLGVEPLGNSFNSDYLCCKLKNKKTPLKSALLDQRIIAGLGNIYVCESLWYAELSPLSSAGDLVRPDGNPTSKAEKLVDSIRAVLTKAIKAGGSTLKDHKSVDGKMGYFQYGFVVYDREGQNCQREKCNGTIVRLVQSGRSTFCCASCQLNNEPIGD